MVLTATGDDYRLTFPAMSTTCRLNFRAATNALARQVQTEARAWVATFEAKYSRFIPTSLVSRINTSRDWVEVDEETDRLFDLCNEMVFLTGGAFDPVSAPGWSAVERRPGAVRLPAGARLDLGGIGKEYAVDRVFNLARQHGLLDVLVDFGQDVRVYGQSPGKDAWYIGLEDPAQPGHCWSTVAVTNHAVATSGDYFRPGHIRDPRTGQPVHNGCRAVTVIAGNCTQAGILSTAAFVLGPPAGLELVQLCLGAEACIITETNRYQTRNFDAYVVH